MAATAQTRRAACVALFLALSLLLLLLSQSRPQAATDLSGSHRPHVPLLAAAARHPPPARAAPVAAEPEPAADWEPAAVCAAAAGRRRRVLVTGAAGFIGFHASQARAPRSAPRPDARLSRARFSEAA